jgi:hypothetical protein
MFRFKASCKKRVHKQHLERLHQRKIINGVTSGAGAIEKGNGNESSDDDLPVLEFASIDESIHPSSSSNLFNSIDYNDDSGVASHSPFSQTSNF